MLNKIYNKRQGHKKDPLDDKKYDGQPVDPFKLKTLKNPVEYEGNNKPEYIILYRNRIVLPWPEIKGHGNGLKGYIER